MAVLMEPLAGATEFYVTGGNLGPDAPSYIERQADQELYEGLSRGEFCYVLTSRQRGKSSLMVRAAARLRQEGVAVAVADLTGIGRHVTVAQWYDGLLRHVAQGLDLEAELEEFWQAHSRLGPAQRWLSALREVVLARWPGRVVIFVDEIDAVRSLPFATDEFFAAIRACYNLRAHQPEFQRLTFCLLGVATPADLIRDTRTTPFNIGRRIELTDFTEAEGAPLAAGLGVQAFRRSGIQDRRGTSTSTSASTTPTPERLNARTPERLLQRILYWTGGHPYLTQRLCRAVAKANAGPPPSTLHPPKSIVDEQCRRLFLRPEAREQENNLLFVRDRLLRSETDPAARLDLYARVLRGGRIPDDDTNPLVSDLRLAGIVRSESGCLRVRNRIYERVFDLAWIAEQMPGAELRRQRAAYRRGLLRAAAVSGVILTVVSGLALTALRQAGRADRNARTAAARTREVQAALAATARERDRANREAARARVAEHGEQAQLGRAEIARHQAEAAGQAAQQQRQEAVRQRQLALAKQAEAERARRQAEDAQRDATQRLWESYLAQARALRFSGRTGRRFEALAALARAAAIRPSLALRNEAIACMALADIRLTKRRIRPPGTPNRIVFDPQYTHYAALDRGGSLTIRRLADDREILHMPGPRHSAVILEGFSSTGRYLDDAHGSTDGGKLQGNGIWVWDLARRQVVLKIPVGIAPAGRRAYSPHDRWFAVGYDDNSIHLFALPSGREIRDLAPGLPIYAMAVRPDGREIAVSCHEDRVVQIRDIDTGRVVRTLRHPAGVKGIAWSPDGRLLATACDDFRVYVWDVEAGQVIRAMEGHKSPVVGVAFSHRGDRVASWAWDETLRVWDPFGGREVASVRDMDALTGFSPDDRLVGFSDPYWLPGPGRATGVRDVTLLELVPGHECRTLYASMGLTDETRSAGFSRDGRLLAVACSDGLGLWEVSTGRKLGFQPGGSTQSAFFDRQGDRVITAGSAGLCARPIERDGVSGMLRMGPSRLLQQGSDRAAQSFDGRTLATVEGGRIRVARTGDFSRPLLLDGLPEISSLALSPDGRWLGASAGDTSVIAGERNRVWDLRQGPVGQDLPLRGRTQMAFSPEGRWLVTGGMQEYRFWRTGTWQPGLRIPRQSRSYNIGAVAFSGDGSMLAIARTPRQVQLLNPADGTEWATLQAPDPGIVGWFQFNPDGSRLAAGGMDGQIYLWDLRLIRRQLATMGLDWRQ